VFGNLLNRYVGQVAYYLRISGRKYGFLSTHEETIFLKREYSESHGQWILYTSNIFNHHNKSVDTNGKVLLPDLNHMPTNLSEVTPMISTRLAMLTLAWLTRQEMSSWLNPRPDLDDKDMHKWVIPENVLNRGKKYGNSNR